MKYLKLVCLILILISSGCKNSVEDVIIRGKIEGKKIDSITYSLPVNEISFMAFSKKTAVDSLGNFIISLNVEKPAIISLMGFGPSKKMIIEPAQNYDLNLKFVDKDLSLSIKGVNEDGQKIFSELPSPFFFDAGLRKFGRNFNPDSIKPVIKIEKAEVISSFKKLLDDNKISKDFYDLATAETDCYYAGLEALSNLMKIGYSKDLKEQVANLDTIYSQYSPDNDRLMRSSYWYMYAEHYTMYHEIKKEDFSIDKRREIQKEGKIRTYTIDIAKTAFTGSRLEYFTAAGIYFNAVQKTYEEELITLFEQFKKDFPNSKYIPLLEPQIADIVVYQEKIKADFTENMKFVPDYQNINSLEELISLFKGKKLYIDVWATWCGPCKEQFKHNKELKALLKEKGLEPVYISIDEDRNDKQWKDMIKFYNLEGNHIRVNKSLDADLRKVFDRDGMISIPWYIMVDENGQITERHAKSPSTLIKE